MEANQSNQSEMKLKPPSVVTQAFDTVRGVEMQAGKPRHLLSAGALGTCLVFIAGMLSIPRLDQPLTIALYAFVTAIPLLVVDYFSASIKVSKEPGNLLVRMLAFAGWLLGDALGPLAVYVGIVAVVWHLSATAGIVLLVWSVGVMMVLIFVMIVSAFIYIWPQVRAENKNEPSISKPSPDIVDQ